MLSRSYFKGIPPIMKITIMTIRVSFDNLSQAWRSLWSNEPLRFVNIFFTIAYRFNTCKSLFSVISKASIVKPCGLLSLLTEFNNRHRVTRLLSVTLLSLTIICLAYVATWYGYRSKLQTTLSTWTVWLIFPEIIRL